MSKNNTVRKYAVTTIAAAAAVATVAPVVSSADTVKGFPDVTKESVPDHYDNVMELVDQGVIKGFEDNKFHPFDSIKRVQVAAMFVKAMDLETPENVGEILEQYSDVNADGEHADQIAAVTEAGVFKGSAGEFGTWNDINREQMATVLVKAYDLDEINTDKNVEMNLSNVDDSHKKNVQILANLGITNQVDDFRPSEDINRAQFSTMMVKTQNAVAEADKALEVESVSAPNATSMEVTVTGNPSGLSAEDFAFDNDLEVRDVEVVEDETNDADATHKVLLTTSKQKSGVTYNLVKVGGEELEESIEAEVSEVELDIEEVAATTESIKQAEDQELEFTIDGESYTLSQLEKSDYDVEFLFNNNSYEVNENGLFDASGLHHEDNFRYAVKVSKDGESVTSEQQTVTVYAEDNVVEVTKAAMFDGDDEWDLDYITSNDSVSLKAVEGLNHFDETLSVENDQELPSVEKVTSSNPAVAYYDQGKIQAVSTGEVTFTMTFEGLDQEFDYTVDVKEDQKASAINEDEATKKFSAEKDTTIELTVLDQYGETLRGDSELDYTIKDDEGEEVENVGNAKISDSVLTISELNLEKGEYTLEINNGSTTIGTVNLNAVDIDVDGVDEFTLTADEETVDLYDEDEKEFNENPAFTITAGAIYDDLELAESDVKAALDELEGELQVRSSNEDVIEVADDGDLDDLEITATATKEEIGTSTIYLEEVEGDFTTTLASIDLTVENSTPQIKNLELAEDVEHLVVTKDSDDNWKVVDATQLNSPDVDEITDEMIDNVTYSPSDEQAVITLDSRYSNETFQVAAVSKAERLEKEMADVKAAFKEQDLTVTKDDDDFSYTVTGSEEALKNLGTEEGTNFFVELVNQGINEMKVGSKTIDISENPGEAKTDIMSALEDDGSVEITLLVPYGVDEKAEITYTVKADLE